MNRGYQIRWKLTNKGAEIEMYAHVQPGVQLQIKFTKSKIDF